MRILPTATAIVTALVLAGCGSDDDAAPSVDSKPASESDVRSAIESALGDVLSGLP